MQLLYGCRVALDSNMIREKAKSLLYNNLKQKEGKGSKAKEFNASKRWFHKFLKRKDLA